MDHGMSTPGLFPRAHVPHTTSFRTSYAVFLLKLLLKLLKLLLKLLLSAVILYRSR